MNNKAGKPVFDGTVDRILSEKIADHAQGGTSAHNDTTTFSGAKPHAPETESAGPRRPCCGGRMSSRPWYFIACGVMGLAILAVVGRFLFRRFSTRHHS